MYGMVPVEQLIFHIMLPRSGANLGIVYKIIIRTIIDSIIIFVLLASLLFVEMNFKKKNFYFNIKRKHQWMAVVFFLVSGICFSVVNMGVPSYVTELQKEPSMFYEENYIDPNSIEITFPEKKRNLIVIFIESLETGFLTREEGGAFSERLIPEIEDLMKNNINFSASGGFGGAFQLDGTGWTIAGITAQYSGVPLVLGHLVINNYGILGDFLSGASGVGDILYKAGYKNYFILGSEIEFGGRDKYFKMHKNTVIYDYRYFLYNNYIPRNYKVWWGFEDRKLYGFAKEKILEAAKDEPFFVTILTADTHGPDGYLDKYALRMFDSRYKNVLFDMNSQLIHFLEWLKEQGFYENTTVVVLGDHLFMDASIYPKDFVHNSYNRFPVNIFINSLLSKINTKNRFFSHFDIFPALIDSIGGVYNARGLALGRSMNKGEPTLLEKYGVDNVNNILQQKSDYYNGLWGMK
jgi:phosphoglycerol transferase